jgi:hypothetical protein
MEHNQGHPRPAFRPRVLGLAGARKQDASDASRRPLAGVELVNQFRGENAPKLAIGHKVGEVFTFDQEFRNVERKIRWEDVLK